MEWLDQRLRDLAGQNTPVSFGDLWLGGAAPSTEQMQAASGDPRRVVNLQLVTTDLCQQRPFVFPLDPAQLMKESIGSPFFVRREDLEAMFADDVVMTMTSTKEPPTTRFWSEETGSWVSVRLHRMPEPWDLPVIFAVRTSMALPGLFKAVHIFRENATTRIRDDLGRVVRETDGDPRGIRTPVYPDTTYFDDLWFSDGGITSNFPVHLFDSPPPQWPTFALNLGPHPPGFEHQDVWSPEDWQGTVAPMTPVKPSMPGFLGAIFATASAWRDVMQTSMPSARGRVAWVRQRSNEGGTNLYMSRETVASMALRVALAGARLRWRYGLNTTRWRRHEWLRLRTTVRSLDELREATAFAAAPYRGLLQNQISPSPTSISARSIA